MDRDTGLRRTRRLTYGLAGASLAGIVAVGALAQHATVAATNSTGTSTDSTSTSSGTGDSTYPTLTGGSDGNAAATSGGS